MKWEPFEDECKECNRCILAKHRTNVVIGRGNRNAPILFIGEAPSNKDDNNSSPFTDEAGNLLNLALSSLGFEENYFYITTLVKCRTPNNRSPLNEEIASCLPFLRQQFVLIRPKIVVCLGEVASKAIIDKKISIESSRGVWIEKKDVFFMATFEPVHLLNDTSKKILFWEDLRKVKLKRENEFAK